MNDLLQRRQAMSSTTPSDCSTHKAPRFPGITALTVAFAIGIAVAGAGTDLPFAATQLPVVAWTCVLAALGGVILAARHRYRRAARWLLPVAVAALGAGWVTVRGHFVAADDLAAAATEPQVVQVRGVARSQPRRLEATPGSMSQFYARQPGWVLPVEVEHLVDELGITKPAQGALTVYCSDQLPPIAAGTRLTVTGTLLPPEAPMNPGAFDARPGSRSRGSAGLLVVDDPRLLQVQALSRSWRHRWWRWRDAVHQRAGVILASDDSADPGRDALLAGMLLGQREAGFPQLSQTFRAVGLAHLLAISGMHLGVLAGMVLLILRGGGRPRRWHGLVIIGLVMMYLVLIEVRLPVVRAGVMTCIASLGIVSGRRVKLTPLVALSGALLLAWRPEQLRTAGFQLSYAVVLGLIHLAPTVRSALFGRHDRAASSVMNVLGQWLATSLAAAISAWIVATPLTMYHFGMITPFAIPLAIIALPVAAALLGFGSITMLLTVIVPFVAGPARLAMNGCASMLLQIARAAESIPGTTVYVHPPPATWLLACGAWLIWLSTRRWRWFTLAALVFWAAWPILPVHRHQVLEMHTLAVGDGTCIVVRSGAKTVVFDAGSTSRADLGERTIVPALRAIGVGHVDAIMISHANLDHFTAVIEIIDAFGCDRVYITPQWYASAHEYRAAQELLHQLDVRRTGVTIVHAGTSHRFGYTNWQWLHPSRQFETRNVNDTSMVIRIAVGSRRLLLCGDIEEAAIGQLLDLPASAIRADILELPHHGSWNDPARMFVQRVGPEIIVQSTGPRRLENDAWTGREIPGRRLVTARDGAVVVTLDRHGALTAIGFVDD